MRRQWFKRLAILVGTGTFLTIILIIFHEVLVPFVVAVVLAYVLHPVVQWLHTRRIGSRYMPRWAAVLILYAVLFGVLSVFATTLLPRLGAETTALVRAVPGYISIVKDDWIPETENWLGSRLGTFFNQPRSEPSVEEDAGESVANVGDPGAQPSPAPQRPPPNIRIRPLDGGGFEVVLPPEGLVVEEIDDGQYRIGAPARTGQGGMFGLQRQLDEALDRIFAQGEQHAMTALRFTQRAVFITVEFVFSAILSLMLAAFILATTPRIMGFFRSLNPPRLRGDFDQLVKRVDRGLGGVIRGQLLICLINGVLSGIGFAIAGLRYWPVWTLLATVASLVPIFGTIVSSVPAVAIGLSQGWGTGLFVLIWIIAIHELEANIFNPKIMGDAARMHPVIVVFALLAGAHAAGTLGALLGVPVASILQSLFRFLRARAYDEDPNEVESYDLSTIPPVAQDAVEKPVPESDSKNEE